jgi:hypothetical protein
MSASSAPTLDLSSIATAYAAFAGVLAGFAFTGLSFYVTRSQKSSPAGNAVDVLVMSKRKKRLAFKAIQASAVAASGFYAMAALGISTFLYADLAGSAYPIPTDSTGIPSSQAGPAEAHLLIYGIVLALSVLTLFYFMTLMLFERSLTRPAAKHAFWAGTIAGSIVVLRFLADSAQDARETTCAQPTRCDLAWLYSTWGIRITLLAAAAIFLVITLTRALEKCAGWLLRWLARWPTLPSAGVFTVAVAAAVLASHYLNGLNAAPPSWVIDVGYGSGIALIALFTLASGAVIYPRVNGIRLDVPAESQEAARVSRWRKIWNSTRKRVYLQMSAGFRPETRNRSLIWKVPARPGRGPETRLETTFKVCPGKGSWQLRGEMYVDTGGADPCAGNGQEVRVTLTIGSGSSARPIGEHVLAGGAPYELKCVPQEDASHELRVAVTRVDLSAEEVLLCWLPERGTLVRPGADSSKSEPIGSGGSDPEASGRGDNLPAAEGQDRSGAADRGKAEPTGPRHRRRARWKPAWLIWMSTSWRSFP